MPVENNTFLKRVHAYWNAKACGSEHPQRLGLLKYSKEYFAAIEEHRYRVEPMIFSFAQFTRLHKKKVLEVGVGAGTDFLQWARAGAQAYGIDLTDEAIAHVHTRLAQEGLRSEDLRVANCESIPFADNTFDLVYSWGVIHHTTHTEKALREIVRVCRKGGAGKIMVYHRHSLVAYILWIRRALFTGKPWKSFAWCVAQYMESPGTKAFTVAEMRRMLATFPLEEVQIRPVLTHYDVEAWEHTLLRFFARIFAYFFGDRVGWFLLIEFRKRI